MLQDSVLYPMILICILMKTAEVFMTQIYPSNETKSQKDLDWVWDFTARKKNSLKVIETALFIYMLVMLIVMTLKMNDVINYAYSYSDNTFTKEEIEQQLKVLMRII